MKNYFSRFHDFVLGSIWRKRVLYAFMGAVGGYAYYYFIGCSSGACPITGNPFISTAYGAGIGLVLTIGKRSKV
ncbi:MAG: DUF6132 family protein [Bacteroidota bacterium]|jgi:hypothetical protein